MDQNKQKSHKTREHYFSVDNDYIKFYAQHLGTVATAVYTSLCMHSDYNTRRSWPSMNTIAGEHGLERHAVSRALAKLEDWNIIHTERAIDRYNRKRKNNVYTLISKEFWKPVPEESIGTIDTVESHGILNTAHMVLGIPHDGTEDSSNETHITKTIEQNTNCGQEPTVCFIPNQPRIIEAGHPLISKATEDPIVWDCSKAIVELVNSDQPDYRVIGTYFRQKKWSFDNKEIFDKAFKRQLKPANQLRDYKISDITKAMVPCESDYGSTTGWTLETLVKRIDDYIVGNFQSLATKRIVAEMKASVTPYIPGKYANDKSLEI